MVKRKYVKRVYRRRPAIRRRRLQSKVTIPYRRRFSGTASTMAGNAMGVATAGVKRLYNSVQAGINKRRRTRPVHAVQTLSKSKRRVNFNKYSLSRIVHATTNRVVERFQSISNFDTNVGAVWISNSVDAAPHAWMPMLILDCGSIKQGIATFPPALRNPYWQGLTSAAAVQMFPIVGTDPDGTVTGRYHFQPEDSELGFPLIEHPTAVLDWINIRMNLYGQRKRTTKFLVTVFQVTQDEVDVNEGLPSNPDKKALFQWMERPFIYSNLQQDGIRKKSGIKVIKEFTYNVDPMTSIDLNTTTGNIHEANIYLKINKRMDYMYTKGDNQILPHNQADGQDYAEYLGGTNSVHMHPRPRQNVYVAIRAFAPIRTPNDARTADDSPSIDIIARRCMTFPS